MKLYIAIDRTRTKQRLPNPLEGERGALLVALVIVMTLMGVMAAGVYQFTRNTSFTELFSNNTSRAYYIAESGGLLAVPQVKADPVAATTNLDGKTYTLRNGEFLLKIYNDNSSYTLIDSTGTVNKGTWFEAKRKITYKIPKTISDPFNVPANFDKNWTTLSGTAKVVDTGQSDGSALQMKEAGGSDKSKTALVGMNWTGAESTFPNLLDIWTQNNGLLSYDIQVKVQVEVQGSKADHYMEGLSFRLGGNDNNAATTDTNNMYGVSFFHSIGRTDKQRPAWIDSLPTTFDAMMSSSGLRYIIFWKKVNDSISLIDYKLLSVADGVLQSNGEILPWSTLVVKVVERYKTDLNGDRISDDATWLRENLVTAYFQSPSLYPPTDKGGTIKWDPLSSNFNSVIWHSNTQPIIDNSLTTKAFDIIKPSEIGIHAYYDSNAANDQFFVDFAFRLTSGGGGTGDIQYY